MKKKVIPMKTSDFDIFDIAEGQFLEDIMVEGKPVLLRQPRGGAVATHVGGGAVVVLGGEDVDDTSGARTALDTAEIFTDKAEPQL